MSSVERSSFEKCALASGLVSEEQLDEARRGVRWSDTDEPSAEGPPTDHQLANRLVEMGVLNAWQSSQLLEGLTKFTLGPYRIVDSLGQGGMGQVFKAEHPVLGEVAIKVLPRSKSTPEAIANFTNEIRVLAKLDHHSLVRAYDAGHDGNVYYLVTEYVPGCDLRKLVRRDGPLDMHDAASIIFQVADGLAHAHARGLIHRDVKPGNVLVRPDGVAKLSDLGLAGPIEGDVERDPRYGKIVGTADYLSPDHIKAPWDPKPSWDIYSLGCTLYYAVTGKVPYPGGSTSDKARAHCELRPLDPRRLNSLLSHDFVDALADMMAKDSQQRIASAEEVMRRLEPWAVRRPLPGVASVERATMPGLQAVVDGLDPGAAPPTAEPPGLGSATRTARSPAVPPRPSAARRIAPGPSQTSVAETVDSDSSGLIVETGDAMPPVAYIPPPPRVVPRSIQASGNIWTDYWWIWLVLLPAIPLTALTIVGAVWLLRLFQLM